MTNILILYIPDGTNINIIFHNLKTFQIVLVLHNLPNRNKAVCLFEAFILLEKAALEGAHSGSVSH
jgi:hypothetical protein